MTPREQAAFVQGVEAARQAAMIAAVSIEIRDDAGELRQRAAVAALQGLADGLKTAFLDLPPEPITCIPAEFAARETISDLSTDAGANV